MQYKTTEAALVLTSIARKNLQHVPRTNGHCCCSVRATDYKRRHTYVQRQQYAGGEQAYHPSPHGFLWRVRREVSIFFRLNEPVLKKMSTIFHSKKYPQEQEGLRHGVVIPTTLSSSSDAARQQWSKTLLPLRLRIAFAVKKMGS